MKAKRRSTVAINAPFVAEQLKSRQLRIWWVSEKIRVHRKTITRWLKGEVRQAKPHNLEALAQILECSFDDLVLPKEPRSVEPNAWRYVPPSRS